MQGFYMIPDYRNLEESGKFAQEQGLCFEYNDFFTPAVLDDERVIKERTRAYCGMKRERSGDTMHGAFFDVTVFSSDAKIREISLLRMRQSMQIAEELGLRAVIFHGNYLPFLRGASYDANWLKYTEEAVRSLLEEFHGPEIYMENMFEDSPELLGVLAERLQGVERFGVCLDYSHAALTSGNLEPWFVRLSPYIRHMHINDHCFEGDAHLVPGEGKTDWEEYRRWKETYAPEATVLFEVSGIEAARRSVEFFRSQGLTGCAGKGKNEKSGK